MSDEWFDIETGDLSDDLDEIAAIDEAADRYANGDPLTREQRAIQIGLAVMRLDDLGVGRMVFDPADGGSLADNLIQAADTDRWDGDEPIEVGHVGADGWALLMEQRTDMQVRASGFLLNAPPLVQRMAADFAAALYAQLRVLTMPNGDWGERARLASVSCNAADGAVEATAKWVPYPAPPAYRPPDYFGDRLR